MPVIYPAFSRPQPSGRRIAGAGRRGFAGADRRPENVLGVLVNGDGPNLPSSKEVFYRQLALQAFRYRLCVMLVHPHRNGRPAGIAPAFRFLKLVDGVWTPADAEAVRVDVMYDRFFAKRQGEYRAAAEFMHASGLRWNCIRLSGLLPDKWKVHLALRRDALVEPLLPATARLRSASLPMWLARSGGRLLLKPAAGMQGRGVICLRLLPDGGIEASGRDGRNGLVKTGFRDAADCADWARKLTTRPYLAQRLLALRDPDDRPFDIRLLVQKDAAGQWQPTGAAVRVGSTGGITANLHGGGEAAEPQPFLARLFGGKRTAELLLQLETSGLRIAELLEHSFGRFAELGLDFGIDTSGRLWFLEANAKPGRSAFRRLGGAAASLSVERPLQYARYLLDRRGAFGAWSAQPNPSFPGDTSQVHVQEVHV